MHVGKRAILSRCLKMTSWSRRRQTSTRHCFFLSTSSESSYGRRTAVCGRLKLFDENIKKENMYNFISPSQHGSITVKNKSELINTYKYETLHAKQFKPHKFDMFWQILKRLKLTWLGDTVSRCV